MSHICFSPLYRSFHGHFSITSTIFAFRRFTGVFSAIFLLHLPYLLFATLQKFSQLFFYHIYHICFSPLYRSFLGHFFYYIYHICFSPLYRSFLSYFSITSTVFAFRRFTEVFSAIYPLHLPNVLFATLQKFSRPFFHYIYHFCFSPLYRSFLGHFSITSTIFAFRRFTGVF